MRTTIVIGAGASGMAAAIGAAEVGDCVTVLERNRKPLKKLAVSGNGRGNLLNMDTLRYYGDTEFAHEVLTHMPPSQVWDFLTSLGLMLTHEAQGRIYPTSYMASVAVEAFLQRAKQLNITVQMDTKVTALQTTAQGVVLQAEQTLYPPPRQKGKNKRDLPCGVQAKQYQADRVIVAVGGAAAPAHGTDGSSYGLLAEHACVTPKPALAALCCPVAEVGMLAGLRLRATLTLLDKDQQPLHQSKGEILFTEDGISGIAAMQMARFYQTGATLCIDMREGLLGEEKAEVGAWLAQRPHGAKLVGACAPALAKVLYQAGSDQAIAERIQGWCLPIHGVRGFAQAQVTTGGISTSEFSSSTLQSKHNARVHAVGEVLNVDGDCGGYNLMFAFASGYLAGRSEAPKGAQ